MEYHRHCDWVDFQLIDKFEISLLYSGVQQNKKEMHQKYYTIKLYYYFVVGIVLGGIYFIIPNIVTKPIPILCFSLLCYVQYLNNNSRNYCKLISIGLLFGSFGDICLDIPNNKDYNFFLYGLVFFLIGHLFYVKAFYNSNIIFRKEVVIPCLISISIYCGIFMYYLLPVVSIECD